MPVHGSVLFVSLRLGKAPSLKEIRFLKHDCYRQGSLISFGVLAEYDKFTSAYSASTPNYIRRFRRVRSISFGVLAEYAQFHLASSPMTQRESDSFTCELSVLGEYAQFYLSCSPSTLNFIWRTRRVRSISFGVLGEYAKCN